MSEIKLGQLIKNSNEPRDAVHVAIAPVTAAVPLKPGEHIGFCPNSITHVTNEFNNYIGIVDPYLRAPLKIGDTFFMCLYPNTITSLKHNWTHPVFENFKEVTDSKCFLEEFASKFGYDFEEFMEMAANFCQTGNWIYDNSESYKDVEASWEDFWYHYKRYYALENARGVPKRGGFFTCSC